MRTICKISPLFAKYIYFVVVVLECGKVNRKSQKLSLLADIT